MNVQRNMEKRLTSNSSLGEAIPARIRTLNAEIRNLKQQLKASKDAERKAAKALKRQHASVVSLTEQHRQASHDVQELKVKASNSKIGRKLAQLVRFQCLFAGLVVLNCCTAKAVRPDGRGAP